MRRIFAILIIPALAAGCMGPRPVIPREAAVAPPAAWRTNPGPPASNVVPDWWRAFDDPVLTGIVQRALDNNTDIATAASRISQARASFRLVRADELPNIDASFMGAPREQTYSAFGTAVDFTGYDGELQASYEVDLFGRLRDNTEAARAQLLSTTASASTVRIATVSSVVEAYVQLRAEDASLEIAQRTLAARQQELALRNHQVQQGYAAQLVSNEAQLGVQSVVQQIPNIVISIRQSEDALSLLLGDDPSSIPRGRAIVDLALPAIPSTLPVALLRRRPDIFAAEQQVVASDHSLDSARKAFLPSISLAAAVGQIGADVLPNPVDTYSFIGSVLQPIFEGGRLRAQADIAAAQRDQAAFAYRKTALTAFQEVEDALVSVQQLAAKEQALTQQEAAQSRTLALAQHRFNEGYTDYFEVLGDEQDLLTLQLSLVQNRADRLNALVALYQAMGGGWSVQDIAADAQQ